MSYFEFPHTRNYDGDLGYIIKMIIELTNKYNDFFEYNSIKFADPLQWDITKQYEAYTIVFDYDSGYSYISKRPIPVGINITNPDYWCLVGPLIIDAQARASIDLILRFVANIYESGTTATAVRNPGDYVVVNGSLYQVTSIINIGETYTDGYNMSGTTIENMILDQFPIDSGKIQNGAVTNSKIADGAVTGAKIAQHTIYKEDLANDKYLFIGDSFNADLHYSWGKKIVAKLGLTLGTNAWVVATPGGGMGNGLILPDVQTLANSMSSGDKNTITKIVMIFGANDWSQAEANIINGTSNLENYLVSTFPNAELIFIAAQWGYLNATYRQGLLTAYNTYASTFKHTKFIDKAFIMMLDPYFVETDMIHPTDQCTTNIASTAISVMNGGTVWNKYYSALRAAINTIPYGGSGYFTIYGDITDAGTHIYNKSTSAINFDSSITIGNTGTQIGVIDCTNDHTLNNFFQRDAIINMNCRVNWKDSSNNWQYSVIKGRMEIVKRSDNDHIWDVIFYNDTYMDGGYNIKVYNLYPTFDCMLDYCQT